MIHKLFMKQYTKNKYITKTTTTNNPLMETPQPYKTLLTFLNPLGIG